MSTTQVTPPTEGVVPVIAEYIGIRPGYCGGKPHILGHRIKVSHVARWKNLEGMTPEEIVATYTTLNLPKVYAALAYYYAHKDEIDVEIADDERFVAEMMAKAGPSRIHKLLAEQEGENASLPPG